MKAGMDIARINCSHGSHEEHLEVINLLKKARDDLGKPLSIMLDTRGPEIRITQVQGDGIPLKKGQEYKLFRDSREGTAEGVGVHPSYVIDQLKVGMKILFDDGNIEAVISEKKEDHVTIIIDNAGVLKSRKKINIPHEEISLPAMTDEDVQDLTFGCEQDVDVIAASFVRDADNVIEIRKVLKKHSQKNILIMSKIESVLGIKNFESILQVSDGIMVARGDLGVELPLNQIPKFQKMMIRKCNLEGKQVATATQMLESMIVSPRPTRAEVSDVANAIYDSSSCVMLSGESAMGKYPIEATRMMRSIVEETEKDFNYEYYDQTHNTRPYKDLACLIANATVKTAYSSQATAIFTYTSSGFTARMISRFRPKIPIIALTSCKKTYHQLALVWGVVPVLREYKDPENAFNMAMCFALEKGYVHYGDMVLVTAGTPFGVRGTTNTMMLKSIGDVLVRGAGGHGAYVYGSALFVLVKDKDYDAKGKILILTHCENQYEYFIQDALGVVLQNFPDDIASEAIAKELCAKHHIPLITRAEGAVSLIKEGEMVTLDPVRGIVFKGKISSDAEVMKNVCKFDT